MTSQKDPPLVDLRGPSDELGWRRSFGLAMISIFGGALVLWSQSAASSTGASGQNGESSQQQRYRLSDTSATATGADEGFRLTEIELRPASANGSSTFELVSRASGGGSCLCESESIFADGFESGNTQSWSGSTP